MDELFGPIVPSVVIFIVTMITQVIKDWKKLEGGQVQIVALVTSLILVLPFHIIVTLLESLDGWMLLSDTMFALQIALLIYGSIIYSTLGFLAAIGLYEVGLKRLANRG